MNNLNLKVRPEEAKTILIRSFYSVNRNVLTFCESNQLLFSADQTIETYCHLMATLLNENFRPEEAKDLIEATEPQIYETAMLGCHLAGLLKKAVSEYQKENLKELPANMAPTVRKKILDKMDFTRQLSEPDAMVAEYIIMTYWDTIETLQNIIIQTFGQSEPRNHQLRCDTLSWFLSQQLPLAFIDTVQKTGGSKAHFLQIYQKELALWLGWLIGFYSTIEQQVIQQQIHDRLNLLKRLVKGYYTTSTVQ